MKKELIENNILGKKSLKWRKDIIGYVFMPRYVKGYPGGQWKHLQKLEIAGVTNGILKQLLYFYTALNEPLVPHFIKGYLLPRYERGVLEIPKKAAVDYIRGEIEKGKIPVKWTDNVLDGVVTGLLSVLSGFGILRGRSRKVLEPAFIQLPVFYYIAFFIHQEGFAGENIMQHEYWKLFLLNDVEIRHLMYEAHQHKYLWYEELGKMYKISFNENSFEEVVDVIIERTT